MRFPASAPSRRNELEQVCLDGDNRLSLRTQATPHLSERGCRDVEDGNVTKARSVQVIDKTMECHLLEETGFDRVRSAVVPRFRFRKASTQDAAESYGVRAVMMTALKPAEPPHYL